MSRITLIGDVHGDTHIYQKMLRQKFAGERTIQIGDMGIGFSNTPGIHRDIVGDNHKWFRGNHDDPAKCRASAGYMGDWGFLEADSLFWVAGAYSIDYMFRRPGVSWWEDEELSYPELQKVIDRYNEVKPRFVISHDAPTAAVISMLTKLNFRLEKLGSANSRTAQAFQTMFENHKPEEWVFGHYHIDHSFVLKGTKFTCVSPLGTYQIETGTTAI